MTTAPDRTTQPVRTAGVLIAAGALILGTGLMLGPTPATDTAEALEDFEDFRTLYVVTNAIDLVGAVVMVAGLVGLARVLSLRVGGGLLPLFGGVASALGGLMLALTLVLQSTVDPEIAERYVAASGDAREAHLAVAEAVFDIDAAVFGVSFLFAMGGIALLAVASLSGLRPRFSRTPHRAFLIVGATIAAGASGTALLVSFGAPDVYGAVEASLGLVVIVWLIGLGTMLARQRVDEGY